MARSDQEVRRCIESERQGEAATIPSPRRSVTRGRQWIGNELRQKQIKCKRQNAKQRIEFEECEHAIKRTNKGVELLSRRQKKKKARKRDAPNGQGLNDEKTKKIQLQRAKHRIQSAAQREARSEVPEGHWRLQQMHQLSIKLNDERQGGSKRASSEVACHESSTNGLT